MKINTIKNTIKNNRLDVIISFSEQTRLWLCEIKTSAGYLFLEEDNFVLFIDGRYIEVATKEAKNVKVFPLIEYKNMLAKNYKRIGIEGEYITFNEMEMIKRWFPNAELVNVSATQMRIKKSPEEIALIKKACNISLLSLEEVKKVIKPGMTEKQVDALLEKTLRDNGAEKGSFDAIIASGVRSSMPHGRASEKVIQNNELITIDFGAIYKGYCSDITRTWVIGKLQDAELEKIVNVLTEAQKRGVQAVKPGATTFEIDKVCRDYITEQGYGQYFSHSTGHGLGIDVHELPNVSANKSFEVTLEPGMVITVEPGIYLPGKGGIRIEDDVLVTESGYEVLSVLK